MLKKALLISALGVTFIASSAPAAVTKIFASQNAEIISGEPDNTFTDVGVISTFTYLYIKRDLFQFDLSSIPDDAQITSATVGLFFDMNATGHDAISAVHLNNDNWQQDTITWNNFTYSYSETHDILSTISSYGPLAYAQWNLDVSRWDYANDLTDNKLTLLYKYDSLIEGDGYYRQSTFYSRLLANPNRAVEGEIRPYLEVEYNAIPEPASISLFLAGWIALSLRRSKH